MLHSGSANTGFNLVTQAPIPRTGPIHNPAIFPPPAFSADGSKFAVAAEDGTVSVWDVRNKIPFMVKEPDRNVTKVVSVAFSSGTLGREVLAFVKVSQLCLGFILFMLNKFLVGKTRR
jgi:WD40 repeat protein